MNRFCEFLSNNERASQIATSFLSKDYVLRERLEFLSSCFWQQLINSTLSVASFSLLQTILFHTVKSLSPKNILAILFGFSEENLNQILLQGWVVELVMPYTNLLWTL